MVSVRSIQRTASLLLLILQQAACFVSRSYRSRKALPLLHAKNDIKTSLNEISWKEIGQRITAEAKEALECASIAISPLLRVDSSVDVQEIVRLCDDLDGLAVISNLWTSQQLQLRRRAMEFQRYELLCRLMAKRYDDYVATASFLSPSRIPRKQLPNLQDIPYCKPNDSVTPAAIDENGVPLVADCELKEMEYRDNILDTALLNIFRKLVKRNTGGVTSSKPGIDGLLDQGRTFMLQPNQTSEAQHKMVYDTLGGLMTPVLPPFYRIFMSGIVPKIGSDWDGKQLGPWFYAPWLTSIVTPPFFGFLVGPSYPNRRKDGKLGGLLVEKCKFLQESGCKGLCLHQCKLPAQQFFQEELGVALTVSPNFETQECQWSFGETPLPPAQDPSFPKGCLVGCESRKAVAGTKVDLCNY
ncbi:hypothetical protein MPSEU_000079600 [Mayamaea pseudoterrestris]|nr:hypothetical protein MPSEU_000079600 [Mayamaea pseudoterrestris]